MIMKICSVQDSKSEAWMTPMFFQATGQAIRSFSDAVNDGESDFAKHPEDYTLFVIGEFDQREGIITPCVPTVLCLGINVRMEVEV